MLSPLRNPHEGSATEPIGENDIIRKTGSALSCSADREGPNSQHVHKIWCTSAIWFSRYANRQTHRPAHHNTSNLPGGSNKIVVKVFMYAD